jgi:hypothetical protein
MDFNELVRTIGLWPALVVILAWWIDRIRREQIADLRRRVETLETEAHKTIEAKNLELDQLRRIAMERGGRP